MSLVDTRLCCALPLAFHRRFRARHRDFRPAVATGHVAGGPVCEKEDIGHFSALGLPVQFTE